MKLLAMAATTAMLAAAQDWPQHLGPKRNGVYAGPFSEKTDGKRLWKHAAGAGFSSVAVAGGRVIAFHRLNDEEIIEAIDAATGTTQWKHAYHTGYRDDFGFSEGPRATPAVDGGNVYTYGAEGMLTCVRLDTGKRVWQLDARKEFGVRKEFFGAACNPLVHGGSVLMNIGGANGAGIVAIEKLTGKTRWKALSSEAGYASPTLAAIGGADHALFFTRDGLVDADPSTGKIRFEHRWRSRSQASVNAATPLAHGSQVFITASYGTGAALLDIAQGKPKVIWSGDDSLSAHYATPVLHEGHLYGFDGRQEMGQELRCVEWSTGKVKWSVPGLRAGTVTLAGGNLVVLTEGGEAQIAPASPAAYKPVKKFRVAESLVRAYPAFSDGRMFVRTESELAAWNVK
ncbi:MAG: PQQ-binding-like beta-propeller repeat protein [Bryobacteraceae bacterium]